MGGEEACSNPLNNRTRTILPMNPPNPPETPSSSPSQAPKAVPNASDLKSRLLEWTPVILSLLLCVSLVMPWLSPRGDNSQMRFWQLQEQVSIWGLLWLIPLLTLATLVAQLKARDWRVSAALTGLIPMIELVAYLCRNYRAPLRHYFAAIESGYWLAMSAGIALLVFTYVRWSSVKARAVTGRVQSEVTGTFQKMDSDPSANEQPASAPVDSRKTEVLEHWISFADGFQFSTEEFYTAVEKELLTRKVPGLAMSRVDFAEGGLLSDQRVYLRMVRERLVFDVCAAPFGTRFFFSCRMAEISNAIQLWQLLVMFTALSIIAGLCLQFFGVITGAVLLAVSLLMLVWLMRNTLALGLQDLDAAFIRSPLIGPIYERWFRKETYYRVDTRLMYLDTVSNVVKKLAEEVTGSKGVKLVRQYEQAPILGELYKPVQPRVETERKG